MGEDQVPGFFKTTPEPLRPGAGEKSESKFRRAAKFFILIGSERAADILSRLPPDQIEAISKEIAAVTAIGPEEKQVILEEFGSLLTTPWQMQGASALAAHPGKAKLPASP